VCGQPKSKLREQLYGVPTCRRCIDGFTKRRSIAGVIDWIVLPIVLLSGTGFAMGVLSVIVEDMGANRLVVLAFEMFSLLVPSAMFLLFCAKDGFSGYSPGKALCGLRAINANTGQPIGLLRSMMRNVPPGVTIFLTFIVALQIRKGPRLGDGWSKSKVIWQKYADRKPFLSRGKGWVAEQTDLQSTGVLQAEDGNPFRAPQD
jgi:uncharacterized RDD family membrane protein YckC